MKEGKRGIDELRLYRNLSGDVLALDVWNDNAIPTESPGGHDENENETH
jgi:hypothetical protein